ncbi:hypothetical protein WJX84_008476 [Apatococcus fuscideae]|uniref:Cupin type-1 domain-containing protein n=1 Tax=Apatococcus fuscideae TaxID=2026836 RepID=A0AAW1T1G7_9CHLO
MGSLPTAFLAAVLVVSASAQHGTVFDLPGPIAGPQQPAVNYQYPLGSQPLHEYPGGYYRAVSTASFPVSSAMSGAINILKPGGMRELHWHAADEWAIVINGTCRGLVLKYGTMHPINSWDWNTGDIWYFPTNFAHALVGLAEGCSYVTGYNVGGFDDALDSFGASNWLSTTPPAIVAQALGITPEEVSANIVPGLNTFMPQGDLATLLTNETAEAPVLAGTNAKVQPVMVTPETYRLPLVSATMPEAMSDGGSIYLGSAANLPVSGNMSGAYVTLFPGAMRQMHWHPSANEWQYIIDGSLQFGVFNGTGEVSLGYGGPGDVGYAPQGSGHYFINTGDTTAHVVLIWDSGLFTNIEVNDFLGVFSPSWTATSLGTSIDFVNSFNTSEPDVIAKPAYRPLGAPVNATVPPAVEANPPARSIGVPTPIQSGDP